MKISKLKAPLIITVSCFVVALCSEIQCMDTEPDIQEATSYKAKNNHNASYLDHLKPEIDNDSQDKALLLIQGEEEKPETSWASYVTSPIKTVINGTYNIVDFAVKHPTQATIASLLVAAQFTSTVAAWGVDVGIQVPGAGAGVSVGQTGCGAGVEVPGFKGGAKINWQ